MNTTMDPMELLQWVALGLVLPWLGWIAQKLTQVRGQLHVIHVGVQELHRWHAPDASGRQMWKNPDLADAITELIVEIRGLRGDFKDVIPKLSEEHRVQDRAIESLDVKLTEVRNTLNQGGSR